jgi:hypothetical protein
MEQLEIEEFIDNVFVTIKEMFPDTSIKYQKIIDTHFIEVSPRAIYNSTEFTDLYFVIIDKFHEQELDGILCFRTHGSLNKLEYPSKVI